MGMGAGVLWEWGRKNHRKGTMGLDGEMGEVKKSVGVGNITACRVPAIIVLGCFIISKAMAFLVLHIPGFAQGEEWVVGCGLWVGGREEDREERDGFGAREKSLSWMVSWDERAEEGAAIAMKD
ncbi:unnamed protein product [Prunus armeniaca]|uniref:Uncharacterized protein n=1 Tax=Prunus armeniaca TaxID=36596 RepID=A0A6J5Y1Q4_PRUAR|nr:unnamed protein product [Prunus armeniaca]